MSLVKDQCRLDIRKYSQRNVTYYFCGDTGTMMVRLYFLSACSSTMFGCIIVPAL